MSLFPDEPNPISSAPSPWLYAHCDGGSRGNPGPSGYGAVLTDAQGRTVAELADFLGIRTNNYAEYSGLLAVLDYALLHGHRRLKVVSDSLLMVSQIQGKYKVNSADLKPLWQEARTRISKLEAFEIAHALRHKNKEADALANQAMDRGASNVSPRATSRPASNLTSPSAPAPSARPGSPTSGLAREGGRLDTRAKPDPTPQAQKEPPVQPTSTPTMHRGFTRDGTIHLLGGATLPNGIFVKIIPE